MFEFVVSIILIILNQRRIQDFCQGSGSTLKIAIIFLSFANKCIKMKEFGYPGAGRESLAAAPPLDSPIEINLFSGNEIKFPK